jgi:hypothetical protein
LIGNYLFGESRGLADGGEKRLLTVAEPCLLARAALHREQRSRQLPRLRRNSAEKRARAFTGRRLLHPRGLERVDERLEVFVETLEVSGDRVLGNVSLDGKRARLERE